MISDRDEERRRHAEEERAYWEAVEDDERAERERRAEAKRRAIEKMGTWFFEQFESPEVEMPRDSEEQTYLYPWGGPFDASAVLHDAFDHEYDRTWIDEAVAEIEEDGATEWAPTSSGDYYEHPEPEEFPGLTGEAAILGKQILTRLDALEQAVAALQPRPSALGHNTPPEDIGLPPYTDEDRQEIEVAIDETRQELGAAQPDAQILEALSARFSRLGATIGGWLAKKADLAVDEAIKRMIQVATWGGAAAVLTGLGDDLLRLARMLLAGH